MARLHRRRVAALVRKGLCASASRGVASPHRNRSAIVFQCPDRKALLLGTALASTFLIGTLAAPASAQKTCTPGEFPPPSPIQINNPGDRIECVNKADRNNDTQAAAINLTTSGANRFIFHDNSGELTVTTDGGVSGYGIRALTTDSGSYIEIHNSGGISVETNGMEFEAHGINALTRGTDSFIDIHNSGDMWLKTTGTGSEAFGIFASTDGADSPIAIHNNGAIRA